RPPAATAETPQERRRFLLNLASFRTAGTLRRTLDAVLTPEIPTQDVAFILIRLLRTPLAPREPARSTKRLGRAPRRRVPPLMLSRLVDAMPSLRDPVYARQVAAF